jgi:putative hydrolase of the HAD superfamily
MRYRGLLLDFNGVLTSDLFEAYRRFCRSEGLSDEAVYDFLTDEEEGHGLLIDLEVGKLPQEDFERAVGEYLGIDGRGFVQRIMAHVTQEPMMLDIAERARRAGMRTGVVSNSLGLRPYNPYTAWRLPERFDVTLLSGEIGLRKPDPRFFRVAAEELGVQPEACIFVDDMVMNLDAAREVGMTVLHHTDAARTVAQLERLIGLPPSGSKQSGREAARRDREPQESLATHSSPRESAEAS